MKHYITMKTPDYEDYDLLDEEEKQRLEALTDKYLKWGEIATLVFDTDSETCEVERIS